MISYIFYIIPSIVCIVWAGIFLLRKRNSTQRMGLRMLLISAAYFFMYIFIFTPGIDYKYVCMTDVIVIPLVFTLLASLVMYVNAHQKVRMMSTAKMQWLFVPAIAEGSIIAVLYYIIGIDKIVRFFNLCDEIKKANPDDTLFMCLPKEYSTDLFQIFYFFDYTLLNILLAVMLLIALLACIITIKREGYKVGDATRFLFRGNEMPLSTIISMWATTIILTTAPLAVIGRTHIIQYPWIGISISILVSIEIFMVCHSESISYMEKVALHDMTHVGTRIIVKGDANDSTGDAPDSFDAEAEKEKAIESITASMSSARVIQKTNTIITNLCKAIDDDRVWLNADFRLGTLVEQLGSNRNKVSLIINQVYGKDFKSLVVERRIAEAQRLMTENPTAALEWVALRSGFKDAALFSHRFKDIVGMTPTEWKMENGNRKMENGE